MIPASASRLEHGVAGEVSLRWAAADLGAVVEEARRRHDLSPVAASALGRALTGALLLHRLSYKSCANLILEVRGDGPLGRVFAEAGRDGALRGYVANPRVEAEATGGGLPISAAVGKGILRVRKELADGTTSDSQVELATGEIGLDLAHFLEQSEQTQSAVLVGVLEGPEGVRAAGGLIVETLPGANDELVRRVEGNLGELGGVSRLLAERGLRGLLDLVFFGLDRELLDEKEVAFRCRCDPDRLREHLKLLAREDRDAVTGADGLIAAECAFCGARYLYDALALVPQ
ncbi:MAG: Hsp33 family molecular chaperone HslO [Thermoanaerobaculia bacterium]